MHFLIQSIDDSMCIIASNQYQKKNAFKQFDFLKKQQKKINIDQLCFLSPNNKPSSLPSLHPGHRQQIGNTF